jgi:hypothetical protein
VGLACKILHTLVLWASSLRLCVLMQMILIRIGATAEDFVARTDSYVALSNFSVINYLVRDNRADATMLCSA